MGTVRLHGVQVRLKLGAEGLLPPVDVTSIGAGSMGRVSFTGRSPDRNATEKIVASASDRAGWTIASAVLPVRRGLIELEEQALRCMRVEAHQVTRKPRVGGPLDLEIEVHNLGNGPIVARGPGIGRGERILRIRSPGREWSPLEIQSRERETLRASVLPIVRGNTTIAVRIDDALGTVAAGAAFTVAVAPRLPWSGTLIEQLREHCTELGDLDARAAHALVHGASDDEVVLWGVGAPSHGTAESITLWSAVIEELGKLRRPIVVLLEAEAQACREIDSNLGSRSFRAERSAETLHRHLYATYEMASFLERMHTINIGRGRGSRISLIGIDASRVSTLLRALESEWESGAARPGPKALEGIEPLASVRTAEEYVQLPESVRMHVRATLEGLRAGARELLRVKGDVSRSASNGRIAGLLAELIERERLLSLLGSGQREAYDRLREFLMYDRIQRVLEARRSDEHVVLLAHNDHVSRDATRPFPSVGSRCDEALGSGYRCFGFLQSRGTVTVVRDKRRPLRPSLGCEAQFDRGSVIGTLRLPAPPPGSALSALEGVGAEFLLLPTVAPADTPLQQWLASVQYFRHTGIISDCYSASLVTALRPMRAYDVIVFLGQGTATTPLPRAESLLARDDGR